MSQSRTVLCIASFALALPMAAHASVTISNARTKNMSCSAGVCTPTASNANLNAGDLVGMLAASDITVKANTTAPDIGITDPLTWTSTHKLTLDAYESIHVRAPVVVEGTSGMTLTTNDGGSGGDYTFNAKTSGSIAFWDLASSLVINGTTYTLVGDVKTLASDIAANPSGNYALATSYDASPDGAYAAAPVAVALTGAFEGLGNAIQNLRIDVTSREAPRLVGLFSTIGTAQQPGASVRNLALEHEVVMMHPAGWAAGLAGWSYGSVSGVTVSGSVKSHRCPGGLIAETYPGAAITDSHITATINGFTGAGGLVCYNQGMITASSSTGNITGGTDSAGLVSDVGGLVVTNAGTVDSSFATGAAKGAGYIGGLVADNEGEVTNSYATGSVVNDHTAGDYGEVGGLVGRSTRGVANAYAAGKVTKGGASDAGGAIGFEGEDSNTALYRDLDTSGITDPHQGAGNRDDASIVGLTDAQLKKKLPHGFDPAVWGQDPAVNNGWPYLLANPPQ